MENNIDNADKFLLERNDIIGEPDYSERMFWAELLVEYGKLLQSDDHEAFEVMARIYPHEMYDSRPDDFCKYIRDQGYDLLDEEIKECIETTRNS